MGTENGSRIDPPGEGAGERPLGLTFQSKFAGCADSGYRYAKQKAIIRAGAREERLARGREWTLELTTMEHLRDATTRATQGMQSGKSRIGVPFTRTLMAKME
jgi:hypothetical protein